MLLSSKQLFTATKEKYPKVKITLVLRSFTSQKINTKTLKELLGLEKSDKIIGYKYKGILFYGFDVAIVPSVNDFPWISHLLMGLSRSTIRIGTKSIDEVRNPYSILFNKKILLSWNKNPDIHISEFILSYLEPLGISYKSDDFSHEIKLKEFDNTNLPESEPDLDQKVILINNEPEENHNRWNVESLVSLIIKLIESDNCFFYYIEDEMEKEVKKILQRDVGNLHFLSKNELNGVMTILSYCDLVISCNSDIMHLVGLTNVPQISIFGSENPFNFAPIGSNKKFIKSSTNLIGDVSGEEVFEMCKEILD
ncbi:MAG: glycosyltransferase family 9 protein [Ignavibacteriae bacterium]|nr:glycosyltransferase family 9 protein [Ignavibacteriota bacterium]